MAHMDAPFARTAAAQIAAASSAAAPATESAGLVARFSTLELQVVAIAERDPPSSLRRPGALSTVLGALFRGHNPRLADFRLEALRRMAVLSWRRGYSVPPREVRAFTEAGYTHEHHEALLDSIFAARAPTVPVVNAVGPIEETAGGVASRRRVRGGQRLFHHSAPLAASAYARRHRWSVL